MFIDFQAPGPCSNASDCSGVTSNLQVRRVMGKSGDWTARQHSSAPALPVQRGSNSSASLLRSPPAPIAEWQAGTSPRFLSGREESQVSLWEDLLWRAAGQHVLRAFILPRVRNVIRGPYCASASSQAWEVGCLMAGFRKKFCLNKDQGTEKAYLLIDIKPWITTE